MRRKVGQSLSPRSSLPKSRPSPSRSGVSGRRQRATLVQRTPVFVKQNRPRALLRPRKDTPARRQAARAAHGAPAKRRDANPSAFHTASVETEAHERAGIRQAKSTQKAKKRAGAQRAPFRLAPCNTRPCDKKAQNAHSARPSSVSKYPGGELARRAKRGQSPLPAPPPQPALASCFARRAYIARAVALSKTRCAPPLRPRRSRRALAFFCGPLWFFFAKRAARSDHRQTTPANSAAHHCPARAHRGPSGRTANGLPLSAPQNRSNQIANNVSQAFVLTVCRLRDLSWKLPTSR